MDDVGAAHEVVDEGLDEDGRFGADNVGAEDEFRLLIDDQLDEAVVFIARFIAHGVALGRRRIMVDGRFHVIAFLHGLVFRQAGVSRFGIGVGRYGIVVGPAPRFRFVSGKEVVRQDFRFVIGLVAEGGQAVDVA